ncbi:MAG: class I SAM-dependent DNA methyltransferase, partial [Planctomycetes bacterium]|nr:class I SAM-dependent DNA methyltransferase [Planctomycetota bacterium]
TIVLDDLLKPEKLDLLRKAFTQPEAFRSHETTAQVTQEAAAQFARIAQLLRAYGNPPAEVAHFLIRLLFCLFAEDVGILPPKLFSRLVTRPKQNAAAFRDQLRQLFAAMSEGGYFGVDTILHVDGGLFNNDATLLMDSDSLQVLAEVSRLDWGAIEPAILGTLFLRGLDPSKRSQQGAHFTSKEDILLIVEPVLMAPLRRRWDEVRAEAARLAADLALIDEEDLTDKRPAVLKSRRDRRTRLNTRLSSLLLAFRQELAAIQILDPACGSGNFLYVALRLLLDLEKEVISLEASLGGTVSFPMVSPSQLHGIEIDPYAYELAQTTIWIGYIQWLRDNGFGLPDEPILKPLEAIRQMDAILAYDGEGKPVEPEWPAADVIIGNPPFLGTGKMRAELGDRYVEDLRDLYAGRVPGGADLVTYWFEKAREQIKAGKTKRAGLLATQAIRKGSSHKVLQRIKESGDIFWAQSDRPWVLEGAAVRVSMVGFDGGAESQRTLDGVPVETVNSDLTADIDLTHARRLPENAGICFEGVKKYGAFDITAEVARTLLDRKGNPHRRPNSDVVKRWVNGSDLVGLDRNMWIIDFGVDMSMEDAARYEAPFEYVCLRVRPERAKERVARTRDRWWLFERPRPELRQALLPLSRFIATPRVAKHRVFVWLVAGIVPDSRLYSFARDDDYFFGVLHSRLHESWALGTSSRHGVGNDPTYNNTTCFETYPFPWPPGTEPAGDPRVEAIAEAARELVTKRDAWLNPEDASDAELAKRTLTRLYNERPTWLRLAHEKLDRAVLDAYGWRHDLTDEQILERLLALNLER